MTFWKSFLDYVHDQYNVPYWLEAHGDSRTFVRNVLDEDLRTDDWRVKSLPNDFDTLTTTTQNKWPPASPYNHDKSGKLSIVERNYIANNIFIDTLKKRG